MGVAVAVEKLNRQLDTLKSRCAMPAPCKSSSACRESANISARLEHHDLSRTGHKETIRHLNVVRVLLPMRMQCLHISNIRASSSELVTPIAYCRRAKVHCELVTPLLHRAMAGHSTSLLPPCYSTSAWFGLEMCRTSQAKLFVCDCVQAESRTLITGMTIRVAQRHSTSSRSAAPANTRRRASAGVMCTPLISLRPSAHLVRC